MTCHYPDLCSVFDWPKQISLAVRPIGSFSQLWVLTRHQYGIFALVPQPSFRGQTSSSFAKCRLFSQANSPSVARLYQKKNIKLLFAGKLMPRERKSYSPSVHRTTQRLRMDYDTIRFLTGIKEKQHVL